MARWAKRASRRLLGETQKEVVVEAARMGGSVGRDKVQTDDQLLPIDHKDKSNSNI